MPHSVKSKENGGMQTQCSASFLYSYIIQDPKSENDFPHFQTESSHISNIIRQIPAEMTRCQLIYIIPHWDSLSLWFLVIPSWQVGRTVRVDEMTQKLMTQNLKAFDHQIPHTEKNKLPQILNFSPIWPPHVHSSPHVHTHTHMCIQSHMHTYRYTQNTSRNTL